MTSRVNSGSFRDPSGFLFWQDGSLYRQVNTTYRDNYEHLMKSGLYEALTTDGLLIPHEEVDIEFPQPDLASNVIRPELIPFISYPYEWCFSQLKDAALTTLRIQKICLDFGMSLKDCSAYNIQFRKGRPVLIDTLSFEKYHEGQPWVAYRQFCQHFLAPLALTSYKDTRLNQLLRIYIDGIPLDLASSLLPFHTYLMFSLLSHIHLHARSQKRFASKTVDTTRYEVSRLSFLGIVDSLESAIRKQKWQPHSMEWADYYQDTNYSSDAFVHKKQIVAEFIDKIDPGSIWDLGANVGVFSRIASDKGIPTVSFDIDSAAVENNYLECVRREETNILPLVLDLTNPSPGIGWGNEERLSLAERGPTDCVLALALVHHLVVSNNVPFNRIAGFLGDICRSLIIEFVPKSDSQVQRLLATREDIFPDYTQQCFENEFKKYFRIESSAGIRDSQRTLYLMRKR
jgi:ribosomal protein L11 methylase PrmA